MPDLREWIEADGLGGFASGTVSGIRTRRYHALLLVARRPPTDRFVLVNGFDAWVETERGKFPLTSQHYTPDVIDPDGWTRVQAFQADPWPKWTFRCEDGTELTQEIVVPRGARRTILCWRVPSRKVQATLCVKPFISGRDYHALHHENPDFSFGAVQRPHLLEWTPYAGSPVLRARFSGGFEAKPEWYRNFLYDKERERGLDDTEDLACPGTFRFGLGAGPAFLVFSADELSTDEPLEAVLQAERARREKLRTRLDRSTEAYLAKRGSGATILAGYPWFTDWGRDTFLSLRGLCLSTGRFDEARAILCAWAGALVEGMMPNRFCDHGEPPEFNAVDAALWFVVAASDYLKRCPKVEEQDRRMLADSIEEVLDGYAKGTRHGIRMDDDGLLAAGEPGVQLTWMDAKVGDRVITPRIGKPVEVQALWLNALRIGAGLSDRWARAFARGSVSFRSRFWNEQRGCLYDVVDCDHERGKVDASLRPNQVLAVGGLPHPMLQGERARRVVDLVEKELWTPMGLRTLAAGEPGYVGRYEGGVAQRDGAYHQGTVWPWLLGPFVEAWLRVRDSTPEARKEARQRFLAPLLKHLDECGIGHVSEIADGDAPHTPRGCPFQAWSLAELIRLDRDVLREEAKG